MSNQEALQADADDDMNKLGNALHEALMLAQKLAGRGVDMAALGLLPADVKRLRDAAENAYTLSKVKVPG